MIYKQLQFSNVKFQTTNVTFEVSASNFIRIAINTLFCSFTIHCIVNTAIY